MNWRVHVRRAAEKDIAAIRDWYDAKRPGLGNEFLVAASRTLLRLEQSPEHFPLYYKEFRRALTARFPYKVFFTIQGDLVIVFRVLHSAQDYTRRLK